MQYQEWLTEWLEAYIQPCAKQRTFTRYQEIVRQHIIPALGLLELEEVTPFAVQRFASELLRSGNLRTGGGLAPNSVNAVITVVQGSLKTAQALGYTAPCGVGQLRRPRPGERKIECLSGAEQKALEQCILQKKQPRLYGILLCLYTGLRLGELLALEWTDFDFARGELHVSRSCYDGRNRDGVFSRITDSPKTVSSMRTVPLPGQLLPLLCEAREASRSVYFVSNGERAVPVRSYQRTFRRLQQNLGLPRRGFHSLRHTFATRALECGMDVRTLSEILGHRSPTVTLNRYAHSLPEHKKAMMNRLGSRFPAVE